MVHGLVPNADQLNQKRDSIIPFNLREFLKFASGEDVEDTDENYTKEKYKKVQQTLKIISDEINALNSPSDDRGTRGVAKT